MMNDDPALRQVGGTHYTDLEMQPWELMKILSRPRPDLFSPFQWHLLFTALKYVMRAGRKGTAKEDLEKAIHYLETLVAEVAK